MTTPITTSAASSGVGSAVPVASAGQAPIDYLRIGQTVQQALSADVHGASEQSLVAILRDLTGASGALWLYQDEHGQWQLGALSLKDSTFPAGRWLPQFQQAARSAHEQGSVQIEPLAGAANLLLVVAPARCQGRPGQTLALLATGNTDQPQVRTSLLVVLQLCGSLLAARTPAGDRRQVTDDAVELRSRGCAGEAQLTEWIAVNLRVGSAAHPTHAFSLIAAGLRDQLQCEQLGLGRQRGRHCQVLAIAGREKWQPKSRRSQLFQAVMEECLLHGAVSATVFTAADLHLTEPQRELLQLTGMKWARVYTSSIAAEDSQHPQRNHESAAWIALYRGDHPLTTSVDQELDRLVECQVAHWIRTLPRCAPRWWERVRSSWHSRRRRTVIIATVSLLAGMLAFPCRYKIDARCTVEPVTRRYITVPYEGKLEKADVRPGDLVQQHQVVARMDGQEIALELEGVQAEIGRVSKRRDASRAVHDTALAQLDESELQSLRLKKRILEDRAKNLDIASPVTGVVISGDPGKTEGARLHAGQTLLEIGPLDEMILEIGVPHEEISHVRSLSRVRFRLDSLPGQIFWGELTAVHPRAETRDHQNVFVAEVQVDRQASGLLPGMRGRATIITDRHPLAWNLFHRAWERLLFFFGW